MATDKTIHESVPTDLIETLEELKKHPRSLRLATEFFDIGIGLIRENGLYRPIAHYQTQLRYNPQNGSSSNILTYRKVSTLRGVDRMFLAFPLPEEVRVFEVYRGRSWLNSFNGSSPYGFGIHLLNFDGSPKKLSIYYSLQGSFA